MPKVLISDSMSNVAQKIFEKNNIQVDVKTGLSEEEIIKIIPEYDGMVVRSATKVTKNIISAAKKLKVIGRAGAGVDNIDVPTAKKNNMIVMNTPGGNSNATAEHAFALIMSVLRKIPFANQTTHKAQWEKKNIKGTELSKKTLGIVGFGNVGVRLSYLVKGFNMEILVSSKSLESRKKDYPHVKNVSFDELISKSDIISFHCKAAADGKPMITKEHYKKIKPTAYIINAARGNIVDEKDLKEKIEKFKVDEVDHKNMAYESGATYKGLYSIMDKVIRTGSRIAITISEKI